jgi:CheY-like chemotaxis protein
VGHSSDAVFSFAQSHQTGKRGQLGGGFVENSSTYSRLRVRRQEMLETKDTAIGHLILVVEDVHETRYGMEKLLIADGYRVSLARDEAEAIDNAHQRRPDLILVSLAGSPNEVIMSAARVRDQAAIGETVPVVIFCLDGIDEGDEVTIGQNVHLTRPDNFNQLRGLLSRVLRNAAV